MKDLKHYFVSPKGSVEHAECDLITSNVTLFKESSGSKLNSVKDSCSKDGLVSGNLKKKGRKRKGSIEYDERSIETGNVTLNGREYKVNKDPLKKKRKTSDILLKTSNSNCSSEGLVNSSKGDSKIKDSPGFSIEEKKTEPDLIKSNKRWKSDRILKVGKRSNGFRDESTKDDKQGDNLSLLPSHDEFSISDKTVNMKYETKQRDGNSNKENSACNSESEEKEYSTPENSKNLLSYFSKVDKIPELEEKPRIIKVEAMVHVPSGGGSEKYTPKSLKKRKNGKKKDFKVDYDLITLDETETFETSLSSSSSKSWQLHIQMADESSHHSNGIVEIPRTEKEETVGKMVSKLNEIKDENLKVSNKRKIDLDHSDENCYREKSPTGENEEVIFVCEIKKEKSKLKNDGTLASFFQFGRKMPSLTSEEKAAKKQFLSSGTPEPIKRLATARSLCQRKDSPYPERSHIQQKDKMNIMWNLVPTKYCISCEENTIINPQWSSILPSQLKFKSDLTKELKVPNRASVKDLKNELNLYPISCWYKELKRLKKGKENSLWAERYRPHLASTFLANTRSICKLKAWLTELKEHSCADSCESSSDEFVKDNDKDASDKKTLAILSGLPGTGKTAAVYAIAEEIGYHVLEINASYNRSGKRILNEFSEAMQSHKVGVSKLNFSKVKKKTENPKRSLVLVEDADLLFEDDEGFVSTLITLAGGAKRPIILVVNNFHAKHLSKLTSLCHTALHFIPPSQDRLGSWLRTVSVVEGFSLSQVDAAQLASTQDIRRSLLQLQFSHEKMSLNRFDNLEESIWKKIGEYDFHLVKERNKAKRHMSSLATLDIINRQSKKIKGADTAPYWQSLPADSTKTQECEEIAAFRCLDGYESYFLKLMNVHPELTRLQQIENPRNLNEVEKTAFSMTNILNRRSNALDFWPSLRQISRNEAYRLASHTKRNNRYFNYLSSVGISGPPDFIQSLSSTFTYLP